MTAPILRIIRNPHAFPHPLFPTTGFPVATLHEVPMTHDAPHQLLANPLLVWIDLAQKTTEMMLASAQVITHRTDRMAVAGPTPNAHDMHEFNLMGQEKMEAAVESSQAMSMHLVQTNLDLWNAMLTQMQAGVMAMMSLATSRSVAESVARHATLVNTLVDAAGAAAEFSNAPALLARSGLTPIHARATANAVRLGKYQAPRRDGTTR